MAESGQLRGNGGGSMKEEVRSWMAVKRRERLAKFVAERERLREKEKRPFQPPTKVGPLLYMYTSLVPRFPDLFQRTREKRR